MIITNLCGLVSNNEFSSTTTKRIRYNVYNSHLGKVIDNIILPSSYKLHMHTLDA
jgi:hypothetical protein